MLGSDKWGGEAKRGGVLRRFARGVTPEATEPVAHNHWERFRLPKDLTGKTFLDVGCWEGANCAEAVRRGAKQVVGVDLCMSEELRSNVSEFGFEFVQMDILSEKWLELDTFDVVLCAGVLYHVENVISLLFRLRRVTNELLVLETEVRELLGREEPILIFRPSGKETRNPSNWWFPNRRGLFEMLATCGFKDVEAVWEKASWEKAGKRGGRLCVNAKPTRLDNYQRILPRKPELMPVAGRRRGALGN
jgi:SAM-dependent methyltransferase